MNDAILFVCFCTFWLYCQYIELFILCETLSAQKRLSEHHRGNRKQDRRWFVDGVSNNIIISNKICFKSLMLLFYVLYTHELQYLKCYCTILPVELTRAFVFQTTQTSPLGRRHPKQVSVAVCRWDSCLFWFCTEEWRIFDTLFSSVQNVILRKWRCSHF